MRGKTPALFKRYEKQTMKSKYDLVIENTKMMFFDRKGIKHYLLFNNSVYQEVKGRFGKVVKPIYKPH